MACWCWMTLVFPSRGKTLVGVTQQDSESLGKVGNGYVAVTCCSTDLQAS